MKIIINGFMAASLFFSVACNNSDKSAKSHDMRDMGKDTTRPMTAADDQEIKAVAVHFTRVDAKAAASIKEIVDHYLHIKTALANDHGAEAAIGAGGMEEAIGKLDKSFLTAEQKTAYDKNEEELKEHAKHIAANGDKIKHQRSHFAMLSEVVYELVKDFGAGRPLYHDYCPMYNDNKGAMWLSELQEVSNPYFGAEMLKCGTVEEVIK